MRIKAVIFDMDGLMFDTERLALPCTAQAAQAHGWDMTPEQVLSVVGSNFTGAQEHFRGVYGEEFDYAPVRADALRRMREVIERDGIRCKPGLKELLPRLRERGIGMTVATSSDEPTARFYFALAGIDGYFPRIMSGEKVTRGKPDPEIFLKAAELLNVLPQECVVLEDSIHGIHAAHRAGMLPIMIPDLVAPTPEVWNWAHEVVGDLFAAGRIIEMLTDNK